jgi:hypothetical protein
MTIEERVRQMLAEAVATEPAPGGAPYERAMRRRRQRPLRVAAVAMVLLLCAAVGLVGVRALVTGPAPLPSVPPAVPSNWKSFQSDGLNLKFRYPPDWVVQSKGNITIVPPRPAGSGAPPVTIGVGLGLEHYLFIESNGARVARGTAPSGRALIRFTDTLGATRIAETMVDLGNFCLGNGQQECGAKTGTVSLTAPSQAVLDRYERVAEQIAGTLEPARASAPSTGDPARPACRPDQWRPEFASELKSAANSPGGLVIWGDLRYLQGPACHLRTTVHLTVERADSTPIAVPGAPASFTVEADLPEGSVRTDLPRGATLWFFEWDNWCRQALPGARVRVTADGGGSATRELPPRSIQSHDFPCRPGAPWSLRALP